MAQILSNDQLQNGTTVTLNNDTMANMQLIRSHTWSGRFGMLPQVIASGGVIRFTHLKGDKGSRAGVMYTTTDTGDGAAYVVALAWDAPTKFNTATSPNKLFGICGPRATVEALPWESIGEQLDKAGSSVVYNDEVSKTCVRANIARNPTTNMAHLWAYFLHMS